MYLLINELHPLWASLWVALAGIDEFQGSSGLGLLVSKFFSGISHFFGLWQELNYSSHP